MEVRVATVNDVDDLFLLNELFDNTTTKELMKKSIMVNNREIICIAKINGKAVGYCTGLISISMCYSEHRVDIESLYVISEFRKQGVGETLILCLEKEAISQGIYHFHLNTHSTNTIAQSLYKKIGYLETGEILLDKSVKI